MTRYILRRLFWMIPLLFGITVINYGIYALAPGDPVSAMITPEEFRSLSRADLDARREALGLNKPIPVRYVLWLREALRGNLGNSILFRLPVIQLIGKGIGNTVGAALGGFIIGFIEVGAAVAGLNRWSAAIVFGVLVIVLVFRPSGILGQQTGERA